MDNNWSVATVSQRIKTATGAIVLLLLPSFFDPAGHSAFDQAKSQLLVLLAGVALVAGLLPPLFAGHTGLPPHTTYRRRHLVLWLGLPAGVILLSSFCAPDWATAFWGSADRAEGALTLLASLGLAGLVAINANPLQGRERLSWAAAWGSLPVVVYALVQALGRDPIDWAPAAFDPRLRPASTLGNPNLLAGYLVLVIPVTIVHTVRLWVACLHKADQEMLSTLAWTGLLSSQLLVLVLAGSRGALIGLAAGLIVGITVLPNTVGQVARLAFPRVNTELFAAHKWLVIASLLVGLAMAGLWGQARAEGGVTQMGGRLSLSPESSFGLRLAIWQETVSWLTHQAGLRLLVGFGPDTFGPVIGVHFPPVGRGPETGSQPDRAHNLFLDTLVTTGLLGLVVAGALSLLAWQSGWAWARRGDWLAAALLAAVVGDWVTNLAGFASVTSRLLAWLYTGLLLAYKVMGDRP